MVAFIDIEGSISRGVFLERPNRFLAMVKVSGRVLPSFLPNPGRLYELLVPGVDVFLREVVKGNRKTDYDLIGVMHKGELVSVDTRVPNRLVFEALKKGELDEFNRYDFVKPEYVYGSSRFDFLLAKDRERCLLEVKSCTLMRGNVALFPDAPTLRGRRHLMELMEARREGYRTCVLFVVQRANAEVFSSNDEADPRFGEAFRVALDVGVEAYAYYSEFVGKRITLKDKVEVKSPRRHSR